MPDEKVAEKSGTSTIASADASAETSERDLKPGQRIKGGQDAAG